MRPDPLLVLLPPPLLLVVIVVLASYRSSVWAALAKDRGRALLRDSVDAASPFVMRAADTSRREVMVKAASVREAHVIRKLTSPRMCALPGNPTIPLLDIIEYNSVMFLVQPCWGDWDRTGPLTEAFWAGTVLVQLSEGLAFMHDLGIAHGFIRATSLLTIMMVGCCETSVPPSSSSNVTLHLPSFYRLWSSTDCLSPATLASVLKSRSGSRA
ncbi:hypothetical protein GGX14DRAFT_694373 [Mycena pura]|uniref:Protein kinase domain-containing protein n=1 Tax=Mycena pura TaxID=153505 RepID=A0AAD6YM68_9AGAR|nr:hypothetical protein GGX14DRAFT_694373 [Mycena pura]